ncbi:MAG: DUF262 domain-containing protein [Hyphomonadaceae bacterium]
MASAYGETPIGLSSQILNLGAVLTRRPFLKVPRYQRPYTWTEKEVRRLIQDLWRAFSRGATFYFIGQIVLVKASRDVLEIADGQQRLATLTMIFAYVRDRLPQRARHYQGLIMHDRNEPRLALREDDTGFYRGYVQEAGQMAAMAGLQEIGIDSKDLMVAAARTIADELRDESDRQLDAFMSFVVRATTLNVVDADERGGAAALFNTLNDTGVELSAADNLKCDLLENSRLSPQEADAAARKWEEHEDSLGRERFARLLNMAPFLLTGEDLVSPGDLAAFRAAVESAGGVRTFLFDRLPRFADALRSIFNESVDVGAASDDVNRRIKMMKQCGWRWAPAAIAFLAEHASQHERARRFFQALDRFTYACEFSVIDNRRQDGRFAAAMRSVGDDKALYGPKGPLVLTDTEHMNFIARLNHPGKHAKPRRKLMLRLEAAMPGGSRVSLDEDCTVEHVLPRRGGPWWNERFPDPKMRQETANLLGNLVLVTHDQNEVADNGPFPFKRDVFFKTKGAPVHAVTRDIATIEEWTLDVIEARQERLVRILCADWDLSLSGERN